MATKEELLSQYAEGWIKGDTDTVLRATAPGYQFTDPEQTVSREEFPQYHRHFMDEYGNTMDITGVVDYEIGDKLVACCFWEAGKLQGTGLITVGSQGVEREDVAIL